ncbi:DNA-binding transcriptional LysR family regulator [Actinoplanes lutulentus]|uniref:DNA-binding transcriptional LysR family regulator n=1 Tax=Actinoplanes lutulentus TaxID=1287878 RepID=A0A327Z6B6_9ACTN|nr:LysR family transcriptional regulator [Actinoplanes lutulentus]MBB2948263.1 DNA-binding transcriptional LysR family regulator [Actinoplanes lutulentus]RAK31239.1 DNA-binding transcriptional LysR family regulator [Actinoplanes lutulentus]
MDVQLRHLRALVAVVDTGTFTDAATELGTSQAAVSRSVAALETALGVRILQRTTRHIAPTMTGMQILAGARRILAETAHLHRIAEQSRTELRVGYAWAALGKHTRRLQKAWSGTPLVFVQSNTITAGLSEGAVDVAVIRRGLPAPTAPLPTAATPATPVTTSATGSAAAPVDPALADPRFGTALIGLENRCAAIATDNPMARRRTLRVEDLTRYTVAIDARTGTTTPDLWPTGHGPAAIRATSGVDEWLTLIAAGQAVGITSEATANQNPRPGVAYRMLRAVPPIEVWLTWWRDDPPAQLNDLIRLSREAYGSGSGASAGAGAGPTPGTTD